MRALTVFTLAFAIVYGFVNTFVLWRAFGNMFGDGVRDALPWIVVAVIGLVGVLFIWRRKRVAKISWLFLVPAVIAAAIGLSITDPAFPGKRIHVPQYFVLALFVWLVLPVRLRTSATPLLTLIATALYGIHDEFLQGFHPSRTFGLRDMVVNLCGAASGVFVLLALSDSRPWRNGKADAPRVDRGAAMALTACVLGACLLAWAATGYRNDLLPYWVVLPVLAGAVWLAVIVEGLPNAGDRVSLRGIVAISTVFLIYPLLANVAHLDFA